jgi:hypothetical protein
MLDEIGLASAARWHVEGFAKRSGIKVQLNLSAAPPLNKSGELALYRVLQESLTNVLRHSESPSAVVRLFSRKGQAVLCIRDFGVGIPAEKLKTFNRTGTGVRVGMGGMTQRLRDPSVGRPGGEIDIVCGYRTSLTNETLRAHPMGVARNSLHLQAEAIDLRMPGIDTLKLRKAALALAGGGVGYYPNSDFIHLDIGRVRQWCFDCPARLIAGN